LIALKFYKKSGLQTLGLQTAMLNYDYFSHSEEIFI